MKKVLSLVLAVVLMLAPVSVFQSFAETNDDFASFIAQMKEKNAVRFEVQISVVKTGATATLNVYDEDKNLVKSHELSEEQLEKFEVSKNFNTSKSYFKKAMERFGKVEFVIEDLLKGEESPIKMSVYTKKEKHFKTFNFKNISEMDAYGKRIGLIKKAAKKVRAIMKNSPFKAEQN